MYCDFGWFSFPNLWIWGNIFVGFVVGCCLCSCCGQYLSVDTTVRERQQKFIHEVFRHWKNRGIRVEYKHGHNSRGHTKCLKNYHSGGIYLYAPPIPGVLPIAQAVGPPISEVVPVAQVNLSHTPRVVPADLPVAQAVATSSDVVVNVTA